MLVKDWFQKFILLRTLTPMYFHSQKTFLLSLKHTWCHCFVRKNRILYFKSNKVVSIVHLMQAWLADFFSIHFVAPNSLQKDIYEVEWGGWFLISTLNQAKWFLAWLSISRVCIKSRRHNSITDRLQRKLK